MGGSGEHLVAAYFLKHNIGVYIPAHVDKKDLVIYLGNELGYYGVQVKSASSPLPEVRRTPRYRFSFQKAKNWYNTYEIPIFCCVALDKMRIHFFINDGIKEHYTVNEKLFNRVDEKKSFDDVMKHLNYYD